MLALSMCMGVTPIAHSIPHFTSCSNYTNGKCGPRYPSSLYIPQDETSWDTLQRCDVVEIGLLQVSISQRQQIAGRMSHLVEAVQRW